MVCVFSQKRQPRLDDIDMAILNLYQSSKRYSLEILLDFLVNERTLDDGPSLCDAR